MGAGMTIQSLSAETVAKLEAMGTHQIDSIWPESALEARRGVRVGEFCWLGADT